MIGILEKFKEQTQYNLQGYLEKIDKFIRKDYPRVIEFYSIQKNLDFNIKDTLLILEDLIQESNTLLSILQNYSNSLDSRFWEIMELVDDIKLNLEYIKNTPKWLRSTISKGRYSYSFENDEILKQRETLELLSKRVGSSDKENDWAYIALRNDLSEEGYTPDGGIDLVIQYFNRLSISLETVIDSNIVGEKVYGKDFNKKITFIDDDLEVLSYRDTIFQAVSILVNLKQGDNPEFLEDGIQASLVNGSNRNSIPYQILLRQLYSTFQKDDTLKSLRIIDIENKSDYLIITLEVETRISEVIQDSLTL